MLFSFSKGQDRSFLNALIASGEITEYNHDGKVDMIDLAIVAKAR